MTNHCQISHLKNSDFYPQYINSESSYLNLADLAKSKSPIALANEPNKSSFLEETATEIKNSLGSLNEYDLTSDW